MADILTQLQTCLDQVNGSPNPKSPSPIPIPRPISQKPKTNASLQLATQLYSTTSYLSQRHPLLAPSPVPNDPYTLPPPAGTLNPGPEDTDPSNPRALHPESPAAFAAAQRELARDLIIKAGQIQYLVENLPGIGTREEEQEARIRALEAELREMEKQRNEKRREMRALVGRLEDVVMGVAESGGVVVNGDA
jgi:mediator of RNA polymerase II transcription subunit 21